MRYGKNSWLPVLLLLSIILSACTFGQEPEPTPDVDAIFRAAAETVQAEFALQLTQTALAAPTATIPPLPPTATPIPTFAIGGSPAATSAAPLGIGTQPTGIPGLATPTPLAALATQPQERCRDSAFVADVTYPDGTAVKQDAWLAKVWSIQNTGTCAWDDGFSLKPITGDAKGEWVIDEKKEFVDPGDIVEIRIDVKTPSKKGEWGGCWRMMGDDGYYFGTFLCLDVMVD
jgi:hypothetical protein